MNLIDIIKTFYRDHKKGVSIAMLIVGIFLIVTLIVLFIYNTVQKPTSKVSYQYSPVRACDLLTMPEAHTLFSTKDVIGSPVNDPVVSGHTATSTCSYTDTNSNQLAMKVVALAVLSAVDDSGIDIVKNEFTANRPSDAATIPNLGKDAYFNQSRGQLNILDDNSMLRISYGIGASPQNNTLEDALIVAGLILKS